MNKRELETKIYCLSLIDQMDEIYANEGRALTKVGIELRKKEKRLLKRYKSMLKNGSYTIW